MNSESLFEKLKQILHFVEDEASKPLKLAIRLCEKG